RLGILLAIFVALTVVLWVSTPSVAEAYDRGSKTVVVDLELPLLEEGEELILHTGFTLVYNEEHEQPRWVAYELTRDEVYGIYQRSDNFRGDPAVRTGSATPADYRGSGYDRGHLAPAGDLSWSKESLSDSFYMSNMSPQVPAFNRGIWAKLESYVRNFAATEGSVYVITGPVLTDGPYETIGKNEVSVPHNFFKVILVYRNGESKAIGFILPNEGSQEDLSAFATTVDEVGNLTDIKFFPLLAEEEASALLGSYAYDEWATEEFRATKEERLAYTPEQPSVAKESQHPLKATLDKTMVEIKRATVELLESLWFSLNKKLALNL
ncbi:MAG: DNA/RNA non-specific endonuclease, partial [Sphaerochaetaceae bacterium]